jgi:hypothetical protein
VENGIQISFTEGHFRAGDYWLIPARSHLDDGIEWPKKGDEPLAQAPHGIAHHYAPLALLQFKHEQWSVTPDVPRFNGLPRLTADVAAASRKLQATASGLQELQNTLDTLLEKVSRLEAYMAGERTRLFEDFASHDELEVGHVVALDPREDDHVLLATKKTRRLVVGVVAERLDNQERPYRVVFYGRVRCRVIGSIRPGDFLVASNFPGYAQEGAWYFRPGTVIGKALGSTEFDEDDRTGVVDMLVTLD